MTSSALCEELGDVLLQVMFHARIAAERDDGTGFTVDDVADAIVAKLVRRHPHVFGGVSVSGADEVNRNWDEIKREEKRARAQRRDRPAAEQVPPSVLDGVPFGQPALALAAQLQRRAARAGVPAELARLETAATSSRLSLPLASAVSSPAGHRGARGNCDPELELRAAARRYLDLVRAWERSQQLRCHLGAIAFPVVFDRSDSCTLSVSAQVVSDKVTSCTRKPQDFGTRLLSGRSQPD